MPCTSVIPDSQVVLLPLETHLRVMILGHQIEQIRKKEVRFVFRNSIDAFCEAFVYVNRVPARYSCGVVISREDVEAVSGVKAYDLCV